MMPTERSPHGRVGAIVAAAGTSQRMAGVDKLSADLGGEPLLQVTIERLVACPEIDEIALVVSRDLVPAWRARATGLAWGKVKFVVEGGARRQDSVLAGLRALSPCQWVVVHDGARPCVTAELVQRGLEAAQDTGSAVAAVPAKDTMKLVNETATIESTLPRERLWAVQTPQVFAYDIILKAYAGSQEDVTDDATLVERLGYRVKVFMGSYDNIKVTTAEDLDIVRALLLRQRG